MGAEWIGLKCNTAIRKNIYPIRGKQIKTTRFTAGMNSLDIINRSGTGLHGTESFRANSLKGLMSANNFFVARRPVHKFVTFVLSNGASLRINIATEQSGPRFANLVSSYLEQLLNP